MAHDPFAHLPHLRDQITSATESTLRFTPERMAEADRKAHLAGRPADWRRTDEAVEGAWRAFLSTRPRTDDLWVFGYGSLMWDPGFSFAEVRRADVADHQRRFTLRLEISPGLVDSPMLVTTLERRPGPCGGLAFRIPAEQVEAETAVLWRRELIFFDYLPEMLNAQTPQGPITALSFAPNPADPRYDAERPPGETAAILAAGRSALGTTQARLTRMAAFLRMLGIEDRYVEDLASRVDGLVGA